MVFGCIGMRVDLGPMSFLCGAAAAQTGTHSMPGDWEAAARQIGGLGGAGTYGMRAPTRNPDDEERGRETDSEIGRKACGQTGLLYRRGLRPKSMCSKATEALTRILDVCN